jgi:hypothetical protein
MDELPLVQDVLVASLSGWRVEHEEVGSSATRDGATLTVLALPHGFEITLTTATGEVHRVHTPAQHDLALGTVTKLANSLDVPSE